MNQFLRQMGIPFTVIATKCDKITKGRAAEADGAHLPCAAGAALADHCFSSEDGTGPDEVLKLLEQVLTDAQGRIPGIPWSSPPNKGNIGGGMRDFSCAREADNGFLKRRPAIDRQGMGAF